MKRVILSSGGVDSTTCIAFALQNFATKNLATISIYYGQNHDKELICAKKIANYYNLEHYQLDLSEIFKCSNSPLMKHSKQKITHTSYATQINQNRPGPVTTYIPFRNGLMIASVASFVGSLWPEEKVHIYLGAHADDAVGSAYPDCSTKFVQAMNQAINLGTYAKVSLVTPLIAMNKTEVVKLGLSLAVPFELTWSCYEGKEKACGKCATCRDRLTAFANNDVIDPIEY